MDLKKALTYVAVGFLFTLVNLNITLNGTTINVTPDFIGWILFFFAYDKLGSYMEDKIYMKWLALVLAIISAATWLLQLTKPEFDISILTTIVSTVSMVYLFILLKTLEKVAKDYGSNTQSTILILKYINVFLNIAFIVVALLAANNLENSALIMATGMIGAMALMAAVFTCLSLFRLRKDVNAKIID